VKSKGQGLSTYRDSSAVTPSPAKTADHSSVTLTSVIRNGDVTCSANVDVGCDDVTTNAGQGSYSSLLNGSPNHASLQLVRLQAFLVLVQARESKTP
jgi:hypothetical protein